MSGKLTYSGEDGPGRRGCGPLIAPLSESMRPLRQQVFERVRASGLMPRVQVATELGVSAASVTPITSELIELGLLEEVVVPRETETGRGRPPVALGVRAGAHLVVGMKLSDREHTAVLLDFAGNLIASEAVPREPSASDPATLLAASEALLDRITASAGVSRAAISAVGIGVPGFVDSASGHVFWSSVLNVRSFDLAQAASERLGLPVTVDNDANLVALAELWFGAGRERARAGR